MPPRDPPIPLKHQPARMFMASGGCCACWLPRCCCCSRSPSCWRCNPQLAAGSALAAVVCFWFSRADLRLSVPERVLLTALVGTGLVVGLAWQLGTGLRTIVLGIVPLLVGLSTLLAGGWRAVVATAAGATGIAALAWHDHASGPHTMVDSLARLTLASSVSAHLVLLLGGLVFGVVARMLTQRWRSLANEREHQFQELLASAADRYVELDAELRFAQPSIDLPSAKGPMPAHFIGHHPWSTPGLQMDPEAALRHRADLLAHRPFQVEVSSHPPGQPEERLLISGRPRCSSQGQFLGYWGAGRDISAQQRQREAAERATADAEAASRAKSSFLANMSHEVRTPLNGILGLARLARQHVDERERLIEYLDIIAHSAGALHATLSDVLDLSRAETRQLTLTPQVVDLPALLHELHRVHEALCRERGLACGIALPEHLPRHVHTDGVRLRQILTNYLHNALKFTATGGIGIEVTPLQPGRWRFAVHDSGPGIAEADLPRLFQPFQQLDAAPQRRSGGSGLGLSICRELARALVVEDNPVNMLITMATLHDWGLQTAQAGDGEAALALVDAERAAGRGFDVILMDLQMPGIDGLAATRALRARGVATPVVALTATVLDDARQQALAAGVDAVMSKPIEAERLRALLGALAR